MEIESTPCEFLDSEVQRFVAPVCRLLFKRIQLRIVEKASKSVCWKPVFGFSLARASKRLQEKVKLPSVRSQIGNYNVLILATVYYGDCKTTISMHNGHLHDT